MKRNYIYAALLYAFIVAVTPAIAAAPLEKIGRGVVAVKTDEGVSSAAGVTSAPTALFGGIQPLPGRGETQRRTDHDIDQLRRQGGGRAGRCMS